MGGRLAASVPADETGAAAGSDSGPIWLAMGEAIRDNAGEIGHVSLRSSALPTSTRRFVRFALVAGLGAPGAVCGQAGRPPERPDGPYVAPGDLRTSPALPIRPPEDPAGFASVQVNVNGAGENMVGDAANEPSMAVDPTAPNRMAVGWRQFDTILSSFRQAGRAWTNDGGRTWHFPGVLDPGVFRSDPVLNAAADGTIYYCSLRVDNTYTAEFYRSRDGGQTWEQPARFAFGGDKQWFIVDTTSGLSRGNIYEAWSTNGNPYAPAQFTRSLDGAETFENPTNLSQPRPRWGTLDINSEGDLFIAGTSDGGGFRVLRSRDARDPDAAPTFPDNVQVDLGGNLGGFGGPNPDGLLGQVWVAVDRSNGPLSGNVYLLCSVDPPGGDPQDVMFARSEDGGQTWSKPVKVNDEQPGANAWQWFGTMSVAPNGRIDVIWNDTVTNQSDVSELRYSSSVDGGATWAPHETLGPPWNSKVGWPQQNKIGDYYDMESDRVGANLAYAATYNGEQDVYFIRIGDYDCNGNGVGDAEDLAGGFAQDCDGDGIPDSCEIAAGAEADENGNGVPDSCEACYADFNGDGALDSFDYLAFVNSFNGAVPKADCTADGELDLFDFLCFVNAFNKGC
jgi:hypothetical protein